MEPKNASEETKKPFPPGLIAILWVVAVAGAVFLAMNGHPWLAALCIVVVPAIVQQKNLWDFLD